MAAGDDALHLGELDAAPDAAAPGQDDPRPPRRRGRRALVGALIAVAVLAVLAVVGWFIAESVLRDVAADRVTQVVVDATGADPSQVDVRVGGGAIVPQLLAGALDVVEIDLDRMQVGAVSGAATLRAEGVPLAEGAPIDRVVATITMPSSSIGELAAVATGLPADAIEVGEDTVTVSSEFDALLTTVRVAVELRPSAVDGEIALEPVGVVLGDTAMTTDELRAIPMIGQVAGDLLATRQLCVADTLPSSLRLTDLGVVDGELVVTLRGEAVPTEAGALAVTGSC